MLATKKQLSRVVLHIPIAMLLGKLEVCAKWFEYTDPNSCFSYLG